MRTVRSYIWIYLPEDDRVVTTLDREAQLLAALKAMEALLAAERGDKASARKLAGDALREVVRASAEPALQGCRTLAAEPLPGDALRLKLSACSEGEAILIPASLQVDAEEALARAYKPVIRLTTPNQVQAQTL